MSNTKEIINSESIEFAKYMYMQFEPYMVASFPGSTSQLFFSRSKISAY